MNCLAIDTSGFKASLALSKGDTVCGEKLETSNRHSADLLPKIDEMLEAQKLNLSDIDAFACVLGPGSFTGLRIGLSICKGFAWSLKKPLIGLNSLDLLIQQAKKASPSTHSEIIAPVVHSRRGKVFASVYSEKPNGFVEPQSEYAIESILDKLTEGACVYGPAVENIDPDLKRRHSNLEYKDVHLKASTLIRETQSRYQKQQFDDVYTVEPWYIVTEVAKAKSTMTGEKSR